MKTLIIYATKNGSVEEVAHLIKQKLKGNIKLVNAKKEKVEDISNYDNIIIGSSIYFGQIDRKIKNFIFLHRPEILHRKFGFFILAAEPKTEIMEKQMKDAIPHDLYNKALAVSVVGSQIKLEKFSWLVVLILKYFRKIKNSYKDIDQTKISDFVEKFAE